MLTGSKVGHQVRVVFVQVESVPYYAVPEISFDTKLGNFTYGQKLVFLKFHGDFSEVSIANKCGWVETKYLSDSSQIIFPVLRPAYVYNASHEQTIKLRSCLQDAMLGNELQLPLQSPEWTLYQLWARGTTLSWPPERPRGAGQWQKLLRGKPGVLIGIEPKTGSIMEVGEGAGFPFLAYVESVSPDQTITISSVGREQAGEFLVDKFIKEEWKEWRPVFISFI